MEILSGLFLTNHVEWKISTTVRKYAQDIDPLLEKHGKVEGYERFLREALPYETLGHDGNLLLSAGAILLWDLAIGSSAATLSNANAQITVGDGQVSATPGTVATSSASTTLTGTGTAFTTYLSAGQTILVGSNTYTIAPGGVVSNTDLTITTTPAATASGLMWTPGPLAGQTALSAATNIALGGMVATFPNTTSPNIINLQSAFGGSAANFTWNEWGIRNLASGGVLVNRAIGYLGTKASGATWTITASISIS